MITRHYFIRYNLKVRMHDEGFGLGFSLPEYLGAIRVTFV